MFSKIQIKPNNHKEVILLVDNRNDKQTLSKVNHIDFRNSAFKQTDVDPLEPRPDLFSLNEEDNLLQNLKRRVSELQKRVSSLELQSNKETLASKDAQGDKKKKRRKFNQLARNYKCPQEGCGKIYDSQTSLKNHLKIKHSQLKPKI